METVPDANFFGDSQDDIAAIEDEGEYEGWITDGASDRTCGCSDWVVYLPSVGRAAHISNGDPSWFGATSLQDAVNMVKIGLDLID